MSTDSDRRDGKETNEHEQNQNRNVNENIEENNENLIDLQSEHVRNMIAEQDQNKDGNWGIKKCTSP